MEIYDPRRPEVRADPYPALANLRARTPVAWSAVLRGWLVTRYRDVQAVLDDPRFRANRITPLMDELPPARRVALSGLEQILTRWASLADPPAHARLRGALCQVFAPGSLAVLEARAASVAASLLDCVPGREPVDMIAEFASPLPAAMIAEMLGMPADDVLRFAAWSDDVAIFFTGAQDASNKYDRAAYRLAEMESYFRALMRGSRGAVSRGDVVDGLAAAGLDDDEVVASAILILFAGHQTTTNLIGNSLLSLLRHPAELARLRASPDLMASAVEEVLRYESPIACSSRIAYVMAEIGGRRIARGDSVWLMLNSANRDARQFSEPDQFDITRGDNRHLAFGHGVHDCLGAELARLQARVALRALIDRFPQAALAEEHVSWREGFVHRGLASLKVRVRSS